jgi:hypothetical protein
VGGTSSTAPYMSLFAGASDVRRHRSSSFPRIYSFSPNFLQLTNIDISDIEYCLLHYIQLYQFNSQPASSGKSLNGGLKDGEHMVHYILAKPLHTDLGSMGIPAFDQGKALVSR